MAVGAVAPVPRLTDPAPMERYHARWILAEDAVHADATLVVDGGLIVGIEPGAHPKARALGEVALVPGLVNAHSHAFQRILRGRTEFLHRDRAAEDFWSWRTLMYRAALMLDADGLEAVSRMAFLEMALAGTTSVGEFHYLQHRPDGSACDDDPIADRVIRAARSVGLRIALLRTAYQRNSFNKAATDGQRRFVEPDVATYLGRFEALWARWAGEPCVTVALAPHSIRAVPADWLRAIAEKGAELEIPLHIHACEQRVEVAEAREEYGKEPIAALDGLGLLGPRTTLVHATHLEDDAVAIIAARGCTVCACPTTEANLGDGFLPVGELLAAGVPIALGSDSQALIDPWQEARRVEEHERLRTERRGVVARHHGRWFPDFTGARLGVSDLLWPMATEHGARALGLPVGRLGPGRPADFVAVDLNDVTLAGAERDDLRAHLVFATTPRAVRHVWIGGQQVIEDGRHADQAVIVHRFREVMAWLGQVGEDADRLSRGEPGGTG